MLIKTKEKRKKTGAFKRCILLSLSVKATFDLLDTPTAPDVLQSQCIHTYHTNGLINKNFDPVMGRRMNERTNERKSKNYIPPHTSYVGGIISTHNMFFFMAK